MMVLMAAAAVVLRPESIPQHNSALTGAMYVQELLDSSNPVVFFEAARMTRKPFRRLVKIMQRYGGLKNGRKVSAIEKVLCLVGVLKGMTERQLADRYQHSTDNISRIVHEAAYSLISISENMWYPPSEGVDPYILNNYRFYPYFANCLGALDGTHVAAFTNLEPYRKRKKLMSTNVLGVVNFDMTFQFVHTGQHTMGGYSFVCSVAIEVAAFMSPLLLKAIAASSITDDALAVDSMPCGDW